MAQGISIYRSLDELGPGFGPCAVTIGNFDGVHAGHRRILRRTVELAGANDWTPAVLTFDPHPARVVAPHRAPRLLSTLEQRCRLLEEEGIQAAVILPFSREFSQLSPEQFAAEILAGRMRARAVLVGENFRFGRGQAGGLNELRELGGKYGFQTEVLEGIRRRGRLISSSEIRRLIDAGNVSLAARLLERPYAIEGEVIPGRGVGRSQTVPTLNLAADAEVLPANGVYITRTKDPARGRSWPSVTNVGVRPTFDGQTLTIETHLLEPLDGDPPARIQVEFLKRLRPERRFKDAHALNSQILRDIARALAYFRRITRWASCTAGSAG